METTEMKQKFESLYNTMANSNEPKYMNIFGETMKVMMDELIALKPEAAQEYIERLSAIKWFNYLTKKEAMGIVAGMEPAPMWDAATWQAAVTELDVPTEEAPYYNSYALFVAMNQVVSDHGKTIAFIKGLESVKDIDPTELAKYAYRMAIDLLKDKDGVYDIREYFLRIDSE